MRISRITLNNFRIYKGENSVLFPGDDDKNIFIVSGYNGYGKTTFLTSLVWCLYGKQMQLVDSLFKESILASGGYKNYLEHSLNRLAKVEGDSSFSVSMLIEDVSIPGITVNEVEITRHYDGKKETIEIRIDGDLNELVDEVGTELFIQDFILPKEIAKFFFFDAEKITALAQMKSIEDKKQLSKAYSEVLGIKKYEDLRANLIEMKHTYRRVSASEEERAKLEKLQGEVEGLEFELTELEKAILHDEEEVELLGQKRDELQEKLIREGSSISPTEFKLLKVSNATLGEQSNKLKEEFKELLDLAPFAMNMKLMEAIEVQLRAERGDSGDSSSKEELDSKFKSLYAKMKKEKVVQAMQLADRKLLMKKINELVKLEFYRTKEATEKAKTLHGFNDDEYHAFTDLITQLRTTYKQRFQEVTRGISLITAEWNAVRSKLKKAESKEGTSLILKVREEKNKTEEALKTCTERITQGYERIGGIRNDFIAKERVKSELEKRVTLSDSYQAKDDTTDRLVEELTSFIGKIKEKKRSSLQERIKGGLNILMHKKDFVDKVEVQIDNDIIDILLFNKRKEEIKKDDLSKGEQQLYATAILKALVEESNIEFPVFVDSPLQKFDEMHSENIIRDFYPYISKQVVVLPLLNKEMSAEEYEIMKPSVSAAYLISNINEDSSCFISVNPDELFESKNQLKLELDAV